MIDPEDQVKPSLSGPVLRGNKDRCGARHIFGIANPDPGILFSGNGSDNRICRVALRKQYFIIGGIGMESRHRITVDQDGTERCIL
jgi:hypothetical protein